MTFREKKRAQLEWLHSLEPKKPGEWLIVMGHWPVYSFRGNGPTKELANVLAWMRNVKADAYLCGHDHALQHIIGGDALDPVFLASGAGGYPLHFSLKDDGESGFNQEGNAQLKHSQDENGFMSMQVFRERLFVSFMDMNGTETYRMSLNRRT